MSDETQPPPIGPPRTEEEIRPYTVGELPLSGRILIADYDPDWPQLFAREAVRIRPVLGSRALRIEHAGSTAVPGLAAKPITDLVLVVQNSAHEGAYAPALENVLRIPKPDWYQHRVFKGPRHRYQLACASRSAVRKSTAW